MVVKKLERLLLTTLLIVNQNMRKPDDQDPCDQGPGIFHPCDE